MLALLEYFWTETDWTGSPAPAPSPTPSPSESPVGKGSGASRKRAYVSPDGDFWDVRERYLRRLHGTLPNPIAHTDSIETLNLSPATGTDNIEPPPADMGMALRRQALSAALSRAESAANRVELRSAAARVQAIALDISKIQQQYDDRAIALLLLDAF